ncbi:hypothetical protein GGX14DRAFT_573551 [Mycena pura]|uniref:Uncharacterized protein n=1 Tax=Mycena pura TaxID=153505 RepID=A0AAD6UZR0_9AGAR|nr:hypothetical protein GGX14DRAFT_573551 [Mycena pura]
MNRERRQWTPDEDELLRMAVNREEPGNPAPSKWHAIAQHVPNRTNKDCRKRWYAKMTTDVVKGGWSPDEDQRLLKAIDCYGQRWSLVSSMVQTRNSDQCAKRWCDTLNPAIDRTAWSAEQDDLLIQAVDEHGKVWTKIVQMYFPGRTGLAAKNRYNSLTRSEGSARGASRSRHTPPSSTPSPSTELDALDAAYSSSQYPTSAYSTAQQPGYHGMFAGTSHGHGAGMPAFPSGGVNYSVPAVSPSFPGASSRTSYAGAPPAQSYYSAGATARYPTPSPSQYSTPVSVAGPSTAYPSSSYSLQQYSQQQQRQTQYPSTPYNSTSGAYPAAYPGGASSPSNWGPY